MKVELRCKTLGFSYGDIVEVGNKKCQIGKKYAENLIKDGTAIIVNEKIQSSDKALKYKKV